MTARAILLAVAALMFSVLQSASLGAPKPTPEVTISVDNFTPEGKPRQFPGPGGQVKWAPSSPAYLGDRLQVTFGMSENVPIREVRVKIDGKSLARLTSPPWLLTLDTSRLSVGPHVLQGEVRTRTEPIMYGFTTLRFYVQKHPGMLVKGTTEELTGRGPIAIRPNPDRFDESISIKLRSLDYDIDRQLQSGRPVIINKPVTFYLETPVDRWAYSVTRGNRDVVSGGPMVKRLYLELAPKIEGQEGLLPGELTLQVWGVRDDGTYSEPITIPLLVS